MSAKTTIGELIEQEVRRQGWTITAFADAIFCGRNNVYDIFKRSKMDIIQLAQISKVLNHNFFEDIVVNPNLIDLNDPETEKEIYNRKALSQFWDVVPNVLNKIGMETCIVKQTYTYDPDVILPDLGLSDYGVFFTIGEWLADRFNNRYREVLVYESRYSPAGSRVDLWYNKLHKTYSIDIKIDYKSENEWEELLSYVKEELVQYCR